MEDTQLGMKKINQTIYLVLYRLRFSANDQAANNALLDLYLVLEDGHTSAITAVDGYLENASVIFDANNDGISDLGREFTTNTNGKASVIFTKDEFERFDTNQMEDWIPVKENLSSLVVRIPVQVHSFGEVNCRC